MRASPTPRLRHRRFIPIDTNSFDQVLEAFQPSVSFALDNRLNDSGTIMPIDLVFRRLSDFEPAQIARQVPQLADLLGTRAKLCELRSLLAGDEHPGDLVNNIVNLAGSERSRVGDLVQSLIDHVDFPQGDGPCGKRRKPANRPNR